MDDYTGGKEHQHDPQDAKLEGGTPTEEGLEAGLLPEGEDLEPRPPSLLRKVVAGLMIVVFAAFALGGVLRMLGTPDLRFLSRSRQLADLPQVREWQEAVVLIEAYPKGPGPARTGTGFNLREGGLIVTNRHVVEGASSLVITFQKEGVVPVKSVLTHPAVDLAVVVLDRGNERLPNVFLDDGELPS